MPADGGTTGFDPTGSSSGSSGSSTSSDIGSLISGSVPLLFSLFGKNSQKDKGASTADDLKSMATSMGKTGKDLSAEGLGALGPVFKYLMAVAGGDAGSIEAATLPQRARVMDQYDTARRGAQFLPRGGGQSNAMLDTNAKEASDLSTILASARTEGVKDLGTLGKSTLDTGITATNDAANSLNQALTAYTKQGEDQSKANEGFGSALGGFLATALPIALDFI